jgi:hypothetical protein
MPYFAQVDENNIVLTVIAITQENIDTGKWGSPDSWIQTSYNTRGGKHYDQDGVEDSGIALRYNYAGAGDTYDADKDAFIAPKPYPSWELGANTCQWKAPVVHPADGNGPYQWDEDIVNWVKV